MVERFVAGDAGADELAAVGEQMGRRTRAASRGGRRDDVVQESLIELLDTVGRPLFGGDVVVVDRPQASRTTPPPPAAPFPRDLAARAARHGRGGGAAPATHRARGGRAPGPASGTGPGPAPPSSALSRPADRRRVGRAAGCELGRARHASTTPDAVYNLPLESPNDPMLLESPARWARRHRRHDWRHPAHCSASGAYCGR